MQQTPTGYPAKLTIDYPDRDLNRLTTLLRIFVVIPIFIVLASLQSIPFQWGPKQVGGVSVVHQYQWTTLGILFLPVLLMLVFRQKYPRWWFDWNLALVRFSTRVAAYIFLLRDEYPSADEEQAVHIDIPYPDAKALNRWLPLVKWLLAIPNGFVLAFLEIALFVVVVIAWFAILFTARYPRSLFDFVVGWLRWWLRLVAYAFFLTTDRYPPFSLEEA